MRRLVIVHAATLLACAAAVALPGEGALAQQAPGATAPSQLQQDAGGRQFWGSVGLSEGRAALTCGFCTERMRSSYAGTLAFGVRVRGRTLLGVELQGWRYANHDATQRVYAAAPVGYLYPWRRPVYVKAGLGVASFASTDGEDRLSNTSLAGVVGAGFDVRLTPNYVLTPYLSFLNGAGGTMRLNDETVTKASGVRLLQYGVAVALR